MGGDRLRRGVAAETLAACGALAALFQAGAFAQGGQAGAPALSGHTAASCTVSGIASAGHIPLPGVVVTLIAGDNEPLDLSSSAADGSFFLKVPGPGHYTLKADLVA